MHLASAIAVMALVITASLPAGRGEAQGPTRSGCAEVLLGTDGSRCIPPASDLEVWFTDCEGCPEMVVVPGLAAPASGEKRQQPRRAFAVARHAVTFAQWDTCLVRDGCNGHRPSDEGWGRGTMPVINVSWHDAQAYVAWLTRETGRTYRLLEAEEREHVARAGTRTAFWTGDALTLEQANFDLPIPSRRRPGEAGNDVPRGRLRTVPVDRFRPNGWGLYNVHGNVWEWTSSCFDRIEARADPAARCAERVAMGGSWNDFAALARSDYRIGFLSTARNTSQGFRVARDLP